MKEIAGQQRHPAKSLNFSPRKLSNDIGRRGGTNFFNAAKMPELPGNVLSDHQGDAGMDRRLNIEDLQNHMDPHDFNEQHRHHENNSAEMEGLDLTDENIEPTTNEQNCLSNGNELGPAHPKNEQQVENHHQQSKSNHLSSI